MDVSTVGIEVQTKNLKGIQWPLQPLNGLHEYHNGDDLLWMFVNVLSSHNLPDLQLTWEKMPLWHYQRGNWLKFRIKISFHRSQQWIMYSQSIHREKEIQRPGAKK